VDTGVVVSTEAGVVSASTVDSGEVVEEPQPISAARSTVIIFKLLKCKNNLVRFAVEYYRYGKMFTKKVYFSCEKLKFIITILQPRNVSGIRSLISLGDSLSEG
jgi:hypothetical protein